MAAQYSTWRRKVVFLSILVIDLFLFVIIVTITDKPFIKHQRVPLSVKKKDQSLPDIPDYSLSPVDNGWYDDCRIKLADSLMRTNQSCLAGMFKDIVLVIVYHYPFYESIPILTKFYSLAFKTIVICGPQKSNLYPVVKVDVHAGHYAYECLGQAIRGNPGYNGYMYINDDMIVNWWNFGHFDINQIWIGDFVELGAEIGKPQPNDNWPWWSAKSPGLKTCTETINQLESLVAVGNITWLNSSYNTYINNSRGKRYCRAALSDFFYVPKRFANKFQTISSIFFRNKVFLEIAVPTSLTFLDSESHFEHVFGFYLPKKYGYIDYSNGKIFWKEYNFKSLYFVHPFKLHGNRNHLSEFLFKAYVQYYGDKISQC